MYISPNMALVTYGDSYLLVHSRPFCKRETAIVTFCLVSVKMHIKSPMKRGSTLNLQRGANAFHLE